MWRREGRREGERERRREGGKEVGREGRKEDKRKQSLSKERQDRWVDHNVCLIHRHYHTCTLTWKLYNKYLIPWPVEWHLFSVWSNVKAMQCLCQMSAYITLHTYLLELKFSNPKISRTPIDDLYAEGLTWTSEKWTLSIYVCQKVCFVWNCTKEVCCYLIKPIDNYNLTMLLTAMKLTLDFFKAKCYITQRRPVGHFYYMFLVMNVNWNALRTVICTLYSHLVYMYAQCTHLFGENSSIYFVNYPYEDSSIYSLDKCISHINSFYSTHRGKYHFPTSKCWAACEGFNQIFIWNLK